MTTNLAEPVDMSEAAILRRLEQVRALYKLTRYLRQFRPAAPSQADSERRG